MKKYFRFMVIIPVMLILMLENVCASEKNINNSKFKVKEGEEFSVSFDLNPNGNYSYDYSAILKYDKNIIEVLDEDSFNSKDVVYDSKNNKITISNEKSNNKDTINIKFKVKNNVNSKETTINLDEVTEIDDSDKEPLKSQTIKVNIDGKNSSFIKENSRGIIILLVALVVILCAVFIAYNVKCSKDTKHSKSETRKRINIVISIGTCVVIILILLLSISTHEKTNNIEYKLNIINSNDTTSDDKDQEQEEEKTKDETVEQVGSITGTNTVTNNNTNSTNKEDTNDKNNDVDDKKETTPKNAPSVENLNLNVTEDEYIDVSFSLKDEDKTMSSLYLVIIDESGNETVNKLEPSEDNKYKYTFDSQKSGKYTVKVLADYELTDGKTHTKELLTEKEIEVNISASIEINKQKTNFYPSKNEVTDIYYDIVDNTDKQIESLTINDKEYKVIKNSDTYKIEYNAKNESGIEDLNLSSINYSDGTKVLVMRTDKIDVLKSIPRVENYYVEENYSDGTATFIFDLIDEDKALTRKDGKIFGTYASIDGKEIEVTDNSTRVEVTFENIPKNVMSVFEVNATYDLDTDELNDITGELNEIDNQLFSEEFMPVDSSKIVVDNIKTYDVSTNNEKVYFNKNEKIGLSFDVNVPKNVTLDLGYVIINGIKYEIEKKDNTYKVVDSIESYDIAGVKDIKLEYIVLSDDEHIELSDKQTKVEILKTEPLVENYHVKENYSDDTATFIFDLIDVDKALTKENGKIVGTYVTIAGKTAEITDNSTSVEVTFKDIPKNEISTFEVYATYDLDTNELNDDTGNLNTYSKKIYEIEFQPVDASKLVINNIKTYDTTTNNEKTYFEKNEKIGLSFDAVTPENVIFNLSYVLIGGRHYELEKVGNTYQIVEPIMGYQTSGVIDIKLDSVVLSDGESINLSDKTAKIEVLKSKPKVENYHVKENYAAGTSTFTFDLVDIDNALTKENGKIVGAYATIAGKTAQITDNSTSVEVTFKDIPKNEISTFEVYATYDLDTNELNENTGNLNTYAEKIYEIEFQPVDVSKLKVDNVKLFDEANKQEKIYYRRYENLKLSFDVKDDYNFSISKAKVNGKEYSLIKDGDTYTIDGYIEKYDTYGVKTITLEEIILENNEEVEVNKEFKIEILKKSPSFSDVELVTNEDGTVTVTFSINDNEKVMKRDNQGNLVDAYVSLGARYEKITSVGKNSITFKNVPKNRGIILGIYSDYDYDTNELNPGDNEGTIKENTFQSTCLYRLVVFAQEFDLSLNISDLKITNVYDVAGKYFRKNENLRLKFKVDTNTKQAVTKAIVSGTTYDVKKFNDDGYYFIDIGSYKDHGKQSLNVQEIFLENGDVVNIDDENIQFEILKSRPTYSNLKLTKRTHISEEGKTTYDIIVRFKIADVDNTFTYNENGTLVNANVTMLGHTRNFDYDKSKDIDGKGVPVELVFENLQISNSFMLNMYGAFILDEDSTPENTYTGGTITRNVFFISMLEEEGE